MVSCRPLRMAKIFLYSVSTYRVRQGNVEKFEYFFPLMFFCHLVEVIFKLFM
jgi:hypothetical protein